jgi:hypothetical protein
MRIGLVLFALASGVAAAVFGLPPALERYRAIALRTSEHPRPRPASPGEQAAILRAVILTLRPHPTSRAARMGLPWKPVVVRRTLVLCPPSAHGLAFLRTCADDPEALDLLSTEVDTGIPRVLRQALVAANAQPGANPDPRFEGVVVVDEDDPLSRSEHVLRSTQAVLSPDGRHALILTAVHCGMLCGHGNLLRLARQGDAWVIEDVVTLWMS